ncbi:MAG: Ig-like domain-containing protein [Actinomycetota bacterium]|nr:Ig-like domain-containing protein [Actinomycetota bacterium]
MTHVRRALSTIATTAVVVAGPAMVATPTAHAQEPTSGPQRIEAPQELVLELIPIELPLLSGLAGSGGPLSVTEPVWNLPGVTTSIVWLRDGVPIPGTEGAWSFIPTEADGGHDVAAKMTGTLLGLQPMSLVTNALGIPLLGDPGAGDRPTATSPVIATGTGKVGIDLAATPPVWSTRVDSTTYQWLRAGAPIAGATGTTYRVGPDDVAKAITVRATGTRSGATGTSTSAPKLGLLGDAPTATTPPALIGDPKVGSLLSATPGTWSGTGPITFSYQWYRRTAPIQGATGSSYVVRSGDSARLLAVIVTATRPGYATGLAATSQVTVARLTSTTTLALVKTVVTSARGLLRITLRGGAMPAGRVSVYDRGRLLRAYSVRASDNGTRVVKLPRLAPGRHPLTASFAGDATRAPSSSKAVTLTVRK